MLCDAIIQIINTLYIPTPRFELSIVLKSVGYESVSESDIEALMTDESLRYSFGADSARILCPAIDVSNNGAPVHDLITLSDWPILDRSVDGSLDELQEIDLMRGLCRYYTIASDAGASQSIRRELQLLIEDLTIHLPGNLIDHQGKSEWIESLQIVAEETWAELEPEHTQKLRQRLGQISVLSEVELVWGRGAGGYVPNQELEGR